MDPTATLANALTHLACQERQEAIDSLFALVNWLGNDGFFPDVTAAVEAY